MFRPTYSDLWSTDGRERGLREGGSLLEWNAAQLVASATQDILQANASDRQHFPAALLHDSPHALSHELQQTTSWPGVMRKAVGDFPKSQHAVSGLWTPLDTLSLSLCVFLFLPIFLSGRGNGLSLLDKWAESCVRDSSYYFPHKWLIHDCCML